MTRLSRLALLIVAVLLVALPASAWASGSEVIRDCALDGKLDKRYSQSDYASALKNIPTDVDEYTDCRDVIRRAQLGAASSSSSGGGGNGSSSGGGGTGATGSTGGGSGSGGGTSGGGAVPGGQALGVGAADPLASASAAERRAVEATRRGGGTPIRIGDRNVDPGHLALGHVGRDQTLPTALIVALVALALAALAGGGAFVRGRMNPGDPA